MSWLIFILFVGRYSEPLIFILFVGGYSELADPVHAAADDGG